MNGIKDYLESFDLVKYLTSFDVKDQFTKIEILSQDDQYYLSANIDDLCNLTFKLTDGDFNAQHEFKTKRVIEIDRLKSVLEHFKSLRDKIAAEKISS